MVGAVIERLPDMPPGTLGFRATGEIEREDYDEVLVPALHEAMADGGTLRTLYLVEDIDELEPGALWADSKLGFDLGVRHHEAWVRSAIVTDIGWMARATRMFAWMIPGEARAVPRAPSSTARRRGSRASGRASATSSSCRGSSPSGHRYTRSQPASA